jgi:hypothetical protein
MTAPGAARPWIALGVHVVTDAFGRDEIDDEVKELRRSNGTSPPQASIDINGGVVEFERKAKLASERHVTVEKFWRLAWGIPHPTITLGVPSPLRGGPFILSVQSHRERILTIAKTL